MPFFFWKFRGKRLGIDFFISLYDFSFNAVTDSNGNYYTNLYDDVVYRAAVRCPHPTLTCIDRSFQLDATKGGTITKTFVIKDWDKQSDETSKGKAMA